MCGPRRIGRIAAALALLAIGCGRQTGNPSPLPPSSKSMAPAPSKPKSAKVDVNQAMSQAKQAFRVGNLAATELLVNDVLVADPSHREGLLLSATLAQRQAQESSRPANSPLFLKSVETMRKLIATYPTLTDEERVIAGTAFYNAACTHAIEGDSAQAVEALQEAFKIGFNRVDLLDTDDELDPLRRLPEFERLQKTVERAHVVSQLARNKEKALSFDFALPDLSGKTVRRADIKAKLLAVHLWGTWCVPARKEIPQLNALQKQFGEEGFAVVGIAFEGSEGDAAKQSVRTFHEQHEVEFTSLMGDEATLAKVPEFAGFPTLLFLDSAGKVRYRVSGYLPFTALETLVTALLDDLNAPAPAPPK